MSQPALFALIDCNNFFVSCERIFQPNLNGRPVVVLSSNDGCAVARSTEAKQLGIPMGAPAFKWRDFFKQHGVVQFSGNFELYGDVSDRLTRLLAGITPRIELYSVDESFVDLSALDIPDYATWAADLRSRIWREIGVPVSIGIAPTKTLAKLASERAKKNAQLQGVLQLTTDALPAALAATPVQSIWGVGRRLGPRLQSLGVHTAYDLQQLSPGRALQLMGVHGQQMQRELSGMSCLPLEGQRKTRQSVMHGRMFGQDTNDPLIIEAALAHLTTRATRQLRHDSLLARRAVVSLSSNRHKPGYRRFELPLTFTTPTADTGLILQQAMQQIHTLPGGYLCHRAIITLYDLLPQGRQQTDLLGLVDLAGQARSQARLAAVDDITHRYGVDRIGYAAEKLSDAWQPKRGARSPRYTTNWDELPLAHLPP